MEERVCLIVDDDPAVRNYLKAVLGRNEWQCLEAATAVEARRMIESLHGEIGLILTDIEMPGEIDGIGLAQWVREWFPKIPVILVSGSGHEVPAGFPLVSKPCKAETIMKAIEYSLPTAS